MRSLYHNLPVIGGCEQQPGREYRCDQAVCTANGLDTDFVSAYPASCGLTGMHRSLSLTDALTMTDAIDTTAPQPVTWVLMLREHPQISGSTLITGPVQINIPQEFAIQV